MKLQLLTVTGICIATALPAQQHGNAWFRGSARVTVNDKIKTDIELQHRRQNGFTNRNMLDKNLLFSFRNWVHYQHSNTLSFSVSPFAYFSHYRIIQQRDDEIKKPNYEIRFSAAVQWQQKIITRFSVVNRAAIEYRTFKGNQPEVIRARNRIGFYYQPVRQLQIGAYDELLVNISGTTLAHFYDHNRIGVQIAYDLSSRFRVEIGFIHITRLPLTNTNTLKESDFFINWVYQLPAKKNRYLTN